MTAHSSSRALQRISSDKGKNLIVMGLFEKITDEQNRRRASLSFRLQRVMLGIVSIIVVSFLVAVFLITEKERRDYSIRESESVLRTLSGNIQSDIKNYTEITRLIMTEQRLVQFLRADSDVVDISMLNDARYGVMDILNVIEGVDTVFIIREDLNMLSTNRFTYTYDYDLMRQDSWRKEIYEGLGKAVVSMNSNGVAIKAGDKPMVTIGRAIYDIDTQKRTGILMMNISMGTFDKMLGQLRYNDICILDEDGKYLSGNRDFVGYFDKSFLTKEIIHKDVTVEQGKALVSGFQVSDYPIVLLKVTDYGSEGIPFRIIYVLGFLLLVFLLSALYTGGFIRKNITDPIFRLSNAIDRNRKSGELETLDVNMPNTELAMLEGDYNNMIDHVNELIDTLMEKEKILQRAEMRVLQEQIKPHFLYNSLETIGFLALDAGADKVHDALETLGSFYRNFLSKGGREIPLSREIRIVKDYLSLQKLRYGDIIEDEYDIEEAAEEFIVPKLILQPLVENSIYHGIRLKGEKGLISVSAHIQKREDEGSFAKELHILVRDTGVGMQQSTIEKVLSQNKKDRPQEADESFGLWGTIERIRIYTGNTDSVRISSEIGEYTEIEIIIPDNTVIQELGREDEQNH